MLSWHKQDKGGVVLKPVEIWLEEEKLFAGFFVKEDVGSVQIAGITIPQAMLKLLTEDGVSQETAEEVCVILVLDVIDVYTSHLLVLYYQCMNLFAVGGQSNPHSNDSNRGWGAKVRKNCTSFTQNCIVIV